MSLLTVLGADWNPAAAVPLPTVAAAAVVAMIPNESIKLTGAGARRRRRLIVLPTITLEVAIFVGV